MPRKHSKPNKPSSSRLPPYYEIVHVDHVTNTVTLENKPPYPIPTRIKTKLRCQYSIPGMHYNCRAIGCYDLNGKRYCGHHFDIQWHFLFPIYGQQHDWHFRINSMTGEKSLYESCRKCGSIKQRDGLPQMPCKGKLPTIRLW